MQTKTLKRCATPKVQRTQHRVKQIVRRAHLPARKKPESPIAAIGGIEECLPCPFCGGKAETICRRFDSDGTNGWLVGCATVDSKKKIFCRGNYVFGLGILYKSKEDAIKAWNRRDGVALD